MLSGHIKPIWDDSYHFFPYMKEIIKQPLIQQNWLDAGHLAENLMIETYSQPNLMPKWIQKLYQYWPNYKNFGLSFHKFAPGRYLPDHRDTYSKYREKYQVDIIQVIRILIYLEDWQPGQINTIENSIMHNWKAGDWISWSGDSLHSVVNFGMQTRYALAVTCHQ
jgi:hypothetical protein